MRRYKRRHFWKPKDRGQATHECVHCGLQKAPARALNPAWGKTLTAYRTREPNSRWSDWYVYELVPQCPRERMSQNEIFQG